MMLSEIVRRFFVLPFGQSEIVSYEIEYDHELGEVIVLTWNDSDTGLSYRQEFVDQEVEKDAVKGLFSVTTIDGDHVMFTALDSVDLANADQRIADMVAGVRA